MDPVSLTLGAISVFQTLIHAYKATDRLVGDYRGFEDSREQYMSRLLVEKATTLQVRDLLLARKPTQSGNTVFESLPQTTQHGISELLSLFSHGIGEYLPLEKKYKLDSKTKNGVLLLTDEMIQLALTSGDIVEQEEVTAPPSSRTGLVEWSAGVATKLKWMRRDKRRLWDLLHEFELYNEKLTRMVQLHFLGEAQRVDAKSDSKLPPQEDQDFRGLRITNVVDALQVAKGLAPPASVLQHESMAGLSPKQDSFHIPNSRLIIRKQLGGLKMGQYQDVNIITDRKVGDYQTAARRLEDATPRLDRLCAVLRALYGTDTSLVKCIGWTSSEAEGDFSLVFQLPAGLDVQPIALLDCLASNVVAAGPSLEERYMLAYRLCSTMSKLWSVGWVHKNLRSEKLLFFGKSNSSLKNSALPDGQCFVFGFEFARSEAATSSFQAATNIKENLYRHPARWGVPTEKFSIIHDIYALGVVLLEIGLWRSVLSLDKAGFANAVSATAPGSVRNTLTERAKKHLPYLTGNSYCSAVMHCLKGSHEDSSGLDTSIADIKTVLDEFRNRVENELRELAYPRVAAVRLADLIDDEPKSVS